MECVHCTSLEEWKFVEKYINYTFGISYDYDNNCIFWKRETCSTLDYAQSKSYKIYTFDEWYKLTNNKINNKIGMEKQMLDVLNKTYDNKVLRRKTVPLFMSNPGIGKTTIIKNFVEEKGVNMVKITLSQRMPNEVVGMVMPDVKSKSLLVFDSHELMSLKDGDILFFDETFNKK